MELEKLTDEELEREFIDALSRISDEQLDALAVILSGLTSEPDPSESG